MTKAASTMQSSQQHTTQGVSMAAKILNVDEAKLVRAAGGAIRPEAGRGPTPRAPLPPPGGSARAAPPSPHHSGGARAAPPPAPAGGAGRPPLQDGRPPRGAGHGREPKK